MDRRRWLSPLWRGVRVSSAPSPALTPMEYTEREIRVSLLQYRMGWKQNIYPGVLWVILTVNEH